MRYDPIYNTLMNDSDDFDKNGLLKDGRSLKVRMVMMDGVPQPDNQSDRQRRHAYDFARAELSSRWKGGIQKGDSLRLGDTTYTATGVKEDGTVQLADATISPNDAAEMKAAAYLEAEYNLTNAWQTHDKMLPSPTAQVGGACMIDGQRGTYKMKNGELVCIPYPSSKFSSAPSPEKEQQREPSDMEWSMAGPLSDSAEAMKIKDAAYEEYELNLRNAWKR